MSSIRSLYTAVNDLNKRPGHLLLIFYFQQGRLFTMGAYSPWVLIHHFCYVDGFLLLCRRVFVVMSTGFCCMSTRFCCYVDGFLLLCRRFFVVMSTGFCCYVDGFLLLCRRVFVVKSTGFCC